MRVKERVIKRLNKGFCLNIPLDVKWKHHESAFRSSGGLSWYLSDIRCMHTDYGAAVSATEALTWKRWVIDTELKEIFEYHESERKYYEANDCLIENI